VPILRGRDIAVTDLQPSNCGFDVNWSTYFRTHHAGAPIKPVRAAAGSDAFRQGELVVTENGVEGSLIYALSARLRDDLRAKGHATLTLDLMPARTQQEIIAALGPSRGKASLSTYLRKRIGLAGVKLALVREHLPADRLTDAVALAKAIKTLPLRLAATRPLDEAISTAGGVDFDALTSDLMVRAVPGLFCAGEMLDWDAPTGGYLLTACLATGRQAGHGVVRFLSKAAPHIARA
jgi:uncharacterized flavoprotein (TIGR03862 family)